MQLINKNRLPYARMSMNNSHQRPKRGTMQKKTSRSLVALGLASALMLSGCSASTNETGGEAAPAKVSASPVKELTVIEKVRKADPDLVGDSITYKSIGENAKGKYVVLGAAPNDGLENFIPDRWTQTGKNWTEEEMAQVQMMSVDFIFGTMLSSPAINGDKADRKAAGEATAKLFSKESGNRDQIRGFFNDADGPNPFIAFANPKDGFFEGYEVYQDAKSSRYLGTGVSIMKAKSNDKGQTMDDGSISEIDGATTTVSLSFDMKLTKDGKKYTKAGQLEYDLYFVKRDGKIYHHGLTSTGGDMSAEPVPAKF